MTEREALKLALEALETLDRVVLGTQRAEDAITAIKKALAQPDQLFEENERLHVENRRLIERIETIGVPVGVGGFVTTTTQPEQETAVFLKEWSDWRNMVVQNLMRHGGIDKDLARRLAHFYQDSAPQRTWVGLTHSDIDQGLLRSDYAFKTAEAWRAGVVFAMTKLKEKNT